MTPGQKLALAFDLIETTELFVRASSALQAPPRHVE